MSIRRNLEPASSFHFTEFSRRESALVSLGNGPLVRFDEVRRILLLDLPGWPGDPNFLLVVLGATLKPTIAEIRAPVPMKPGRPAKVDRDHGRDSAAAPIKMFASLEGSRYVEAMDRPRLAITPAPSRMYRPPTVAAGNNHSWQDNLNPRASLALRSCSRRRSEATGQRFEWRYTQMHGSWLDIAELDLGILASRCLESRIKDKQTYIEEIAAWEDDRNASRARAGWQFTAADAGIKLEHRYPSFRLKRPLW